MAPTSKNRTAPKAEAPIAMRSGVKRPEVRDLQVLLRDEGLYDGKIDGWFGNYTRNAVYRLQQRLGVAPNGHWTLPTVEAWNEAHPVPAEPKPKAKRKRTSKRSASKAAKPEPVVTSQGSEEGADAPVTSVDIVSADRESGGVDSEPSTDEDDGGSRSPSDGADDGAGSDQSD